MAHLTVRGKASPGTHVLFLHMNVKYPRLVMGSLTGIEFGGDTCVLVRVRAGGDAIRLLAVGGTLSPDWDPALPLVDNLRRARRSGRFPKHATVVAWDLHESASASDPLSRAVLAPLRDAGFAVDAVLCPADALCALAKRRQKTPGRAGEVWLALNRQRVAMAIVEDGRLLYSRGFDWHYSPAATQRAELLQRYSLVAHLAPEVRHGIDAGARGTRRERQRHRHLRRSPGPAIADDAAHRGAGHRSRDPRHAGRRQRRGCGGRRGDCGAGAGDQARVRGGLGIRREWQRALAARRCGSRPSCDSGRRMDGDAFTVRVARRSRTAGTIAPAGGRSHQVIAPSGRHGARGGGRCLSTCDQNVGNGEHGAAASSAIRPGAKAGGIARSDHGTDTAAARTGTTC